MSEAAHDSGASLRRYRRIATAALLVSALLFVVTHWIPEPGVWVRLLRAGAEAGLIGGIADWFAVTALFQRPLGLPIPHTAIIPRNKDRIGDGLGAFIERNFLEPELIAAKLRSLDAAERIGSWLGGEGNAELVADRVLAIAPDVVRSFDDAEVRVFFRTIISQQLRQVDLVPLVARAFRAIVDSREHQALFDRALLLARELLLRNRELIFQRVEERSHWWVPRRVDRRMAQAIITGVEEWLQELTEHDHPVRRDFDAAVHQFVDRLEHSPELRARIEQFRTRLLESRELQQTSEALWDPMRDAILRELSDPAGSLRVSLAGSLRSLGSTLLADLAARDRLNHRIAMVVDELVLPFRQRIGSFISEVVKGWDARTVSQRLEQEVGRDLQFIRINGTLVGALVGCTLFVLVEFVF